MWTGWQKCACSLALAGMVALGSVSRVEATGHIMPWQGCYVGGHLGGAWGDADWTFVEDGPFGFVGEKVSHDLDGVIGGGQIGCNLQMNEWVFGAELSLSGSDLDDQAPSPLPDHFFNGALAASADDAFRTETDWIFQAVARLGFTPAANWMAYVKAGYAQADISIKGIDPANGVSIGGPLNASSSETYRGYVVGSGVEFMMSPNILLGLDYSFIDLGSEVHTTVTNSTTAAADGQPFVADVDTEFHILTARLSFKLNRPPSPLK